MFGTRALVAASATAALLLGAVATPAQAANRGHTLAKNETMVRGDYLTRDRSGHRIRLVMQTDNNLVLYKNYGGVGGTQVACGASKSNLYANVHAYMSGASGTFAAYDSSGVVRWTTAPYTSGWGNHVTVDYIDGQARATVYDSTNNRAFNFWKC
jgi:hypothetical protein